MEPSQIIELVGQLCGVLIIIVNPLATQFPKRWQIMVMFCIINFLSVINFATFNCRFILRKIQVKFNYSLEYPHLVKLFE